MAAQSELHRPRRLMRADLKRCLRCGKDKPLAEFTRNKSTTDGLCPYCKECQRLFSRESRLRREAVVLEILHLQGGACAICGVTGLDANQWRLDHDHSCKEHAYLGEVRPRFLMSIHCPCVRGVLCNFCNVTVMAAIDSGLALPGPEVQYYLDNPPAQLYFELLKEWKAS
jgi:hypothetical protein